MNKFIRVIENSWTDDTTFLVPYQVLDENEHCYLIMDDADDENWVEKEYCEEVAVMVTEVFKSQRQREIEEFRKDLDQAMDIEEPWSRAVVEILYNCGYRKTEQ